MKKEWRKQEKELYLPKNKPCVIDIPEITFVTIKGVGNPNSEEFGKKVEALYSFSYKLRMLFKWDNPPDGYYEYTVYPLEGIWDIADKSKHVEGALDKDNLAYEIMIRQPEFITEELFDRAIEVVSKKSPNPHNNSLEMKTMKDGLCIQMMHLGPYDTESETFAVMEEYAADNGYKRIGKNHREIYITDPRKIVPEKMKTVLRFWVGEK